MAGFGVTTEAGVIVDDVLYRSGMSDRKEYQANSLAADILMPYTLIQKLQQRGMNTVEEIAEELKVSVDATSVRLGIPT